MLTVYKWIQIWFAPAHESRHEKWKNIKFASAIKDTDLKRLFTYLLIFLGFCRMASNDICRDIIEADTFCNSTCAILESQHQQSLTSPDHCLTLPETSNFVGRTQTSVQIRRPANSNFHNQSFLKYGKLINRTTIHTFKNHIDKFPSGYTETTHWLIRLGKLVI